MKHTRQSTQSNLSCPPAFSVEWEAVDKSGRVCRIKSKTWHAARARAAVVLHAEPDEITVTRSRDDNYETEKQRQELENFDPWAGLRGSTRSQETTLETDEKEPSKIPGRFIKRKKKKII